MKFLVLTLLSGALLALSLPPFDVEWLGWLALVPLLVAAAGQRTLVAMGMGVLAGVVCGAIHVGWYPEWPVMQFAYVPFVWLALLLGAVAAIAAVARRRMIGLRWALLVASAAVVAEWLTTFSPLPLNLALCQYRTPAIIQISAVTGIWGVSFLLWFVNASLADVVLTWRGAKTRGSDRNSPQRHRDTEKDKWVEKQRALRAVQLFPSGRPLCLCVSVVKCPVRFALARLRVLKQSAVLPALAMVGVALGYSLLAPSGEPSRAQKLTMRVAAIQDHSGGETAQFLQAASLKSQEGDRDDMTRQAAAKGARLIVWSEKCLGETFVPNATPDATADLARELKTHLIVGYEEPAQPKPFNCAAIVAPDGRVKGIHRKIHPFLGERQGIQCGSAATAFRTDLGKMGMEICFDSCYPEVTRRIVRAGARIIAMPNWDPPMPRGILHRLHSAMQPFRAVENHVPFIRADANGLSQIIDARGRLIGQAPLFAADTLVGDVTLGDGKGTFSTRWGDWFAYFCLLIVVALSVLPRLRNYPDKSTV
jgi:apolipoprotein N-acyltransferase